MIADLISQYSQQQSGRVNALTDQLTNLGQMVSATMRQKAEQEQAMAILPAIQERYKTAMGKIQSGKVSDGYLDVLSAQLEFGGIPNPLVQFANKQFLATAEMAGQAKQSELWRELQKTRMGADAISGDDMTDEEILLGGIPATQVDFNANSERDALDAAAAEALPQDEERPGVFSLKPKEGLMPETENLPSRETMERAAQGRKAYAENRDKFVEQNSVGVEGIEPINLGIPGIPPMTPPLEKKVIDRTVSRSVTAGKPDRVTVNSKAVTTNQKQLDDFEILNNKARNSFSRLQSNPRINPLLESINYDWTKVKPDEVYDKRQGRDIYTASIGGKEPIDISKNQYFDLLELIQYPGSARGHGSLIIQQPEAEAAPAEAAPMSAAEQVRAKYGKTKQAGTVAPAMQQGMPAVQAPAAPRYSSENPYAKQVSEVAPPSKTYQQPSRSRQPSKSNLQRKLSEVESDIKNIDKYKVGRRAATNKEKADRWEELQSEKNRLEQILAQ